MILFTVFSLPSLPAQGFVNWLPSNSAKRDQEERDTEPPLPPAKVEINGVDGCICCKCNEFYPYAEPNQENGTLICYSCRHPME